MKRRNITTSILSSDASDFLALALALAVIDKTAVVTCKETRTITHFVFTQNFLASTRRNKLCNMPRYSYCETAQIVEKTGELHLTISFLLVFNLTQ